MLYTFLFYHCVKYHVLFDQIQMVNTLHSIHCSSKYNDGVAGYAAKFSYDNKLGIVNRCEDGTPQSTNKAILQCMVSVLESINRDIMNEQCIIYVDIYYAYIVFTQLDNWATNGWKKKNNEQVANLLLIQKLNELITGRIGNVEVRYDTRSYSMSWVKKQAKLGTTIDEQIC